MKDRFFPLSKQIFEEQVIPLIYSHHKRPGRPPKMGDDVFFYAVLSVLRTGISWREMPICFGNGSTIYMQFKRWSENGLFWSILDQLQQSKKAQLDIVWGDSTTVNGHRHGGGAPKKKANQRSEGGKKDGALKSISL